MKKQIVALFVCLLIISMAFAAQAESEYLYMDWEELEQVMQEATRIDEMAKHYDTLKITHTDIDDETIIVYYDLKQDMVFRHIQADESVYLYIDNSLCGMAEDGEFCRVLVVGDVNTPIYFENGNLVYYEAAENGEIVFSCDESDGILYVETYIPSETIQAAYAIKGIEVGEGEYEAEIYHELDGETLAPLFCGEELVDLEGRSSIVRISTFEYDVELPALDIAFGEYMAVKEDLRTVTVIADPDTEHEKAYSVEAPRGDEVVFYNLSDSIYTDRECTEVYTGDEGMEDITLYTRIFSK